MVDVSNIIKAFVNIVDKPIVKLIDYYGGGNRINSAGKALELYVQDAFANTFDEDDNLKRLEKLQEIYSYEGNENNPPDLMLKNSDAIEVKKLQSKNSAIALNSSYPKAKLYAVGYTDDERLNSLWFFKV